MKRTALYILTLLSSLTFFFSGSALAATTFNSSTSGIDCSGDAGNSSVCKDLSDTSNPLFGKDGILTKVGQLFALVTGIVSVFMVILSGLRYVLSAGDPQKTATARKGIMYSAIGVLVSVMAGTIAQFILSKV